jgi:hypothetical protein
MRGAPLKQKSKDISFRFLIADNIEVLFFAYSNINLIHILHTHMHITTNQLLEMIYFSLILIMNDNLKKKNIYILKNGKQKRGQIKVRFHFI